MKFDELDWAEKDGDRWLVVAMTKEQLDAQPAFDRTPYEPAPAPVAATDRGGSGTFDRDGRGPGGTCRSGGTGTFDRDG